MAWRKHVLVIEALNRRVRAVQIASWQIEAHYIEAFLFLLGYIQDRGIVLFNALGLKTVPVVYCKKRKTGESEMWVSLSWKWVANSPQGKSLSEALTTGRSHMVPLTEWTQ